MNHNESPTRQTKKRASDDTADVIAVVAVILLVVSGIIFWLSSLPSS